MYRYDEFDRAFVHERVDQFREQVERRLAGKLTEEEFRPLRLRNGLYLQLHAYMLRIAIPYGVLSPRQLRQLAMIGRKWDRGYGHFTTRQNIQFNWPELEDVPSILDELASVEGVPCYASLRAIPGPVRSVSVVAPPAAAAQIVADAIAAGVKDLWFQPGAEEAGAMATARAAGISVIADGPCVLVALGFRDV